MLSEWNKLTGELSFEERQLVDHICVAGLKETRHLLNEREHETGQAQTAGAILAFETIQDQQFGTCEEFLEQQRKLDQRCTQLRNSEQLAEYWKTRGQQLQIEFVLDRILAYRVMTHQIVASISARAGLYVGEWSRHDP